jgi:hypothetical protein
MMLQQLPYRVGSKVRVYHVQGGYRLPDGLPEGAQVVVVAKEPGLVTVEHDGHRFEVPQACINSGFRVLLDASRPPRPR